MTVFIIDIFGCVRACDFIEEVLNQNNNKNLETHDSTEQFNLWTFFVNGKVPSKSHRM